MIKSRIKALEKKLLGKGQIWAVFTIGHYADLNEEQAAKQRLLSDYLASGNAAPTHRLYCNEIPAPTDFKQEERFLYSFEC